MAKCINFSLFSHRPLFDRFHNFVLNIYNFFEEMLFGFSPHRLVVAFFLFPYSYFSSWIGSCGSSSNLLLL